MTSQRCSEESNCWESYCCWESKLVHPLWKTVCWFLTKLNILLLYDPATVLYYLYKWVENLSPHKNLHSDVYSSLIHNCQNLEATKISFSRLMDKSTVVYSNNGILLSALERKKRAVKPWLSERSQSETATYYCRTLILWHFGKAKLWRQ